jgi:ribosomal protein L12E/L44/L45/RPP1/RPP2
MYVCVMVVLCSLAHIIMFHLTVQLDDEWVQVLQALGDTNLDEVIAMQQALLGPQSTTHTMQGL